MFSAKREKIYKIIHERNDLKSKLFERGYFITNNNKVSLTIYGWENVCVNNIRIWISANNKVYLKSKNEINLVLIGHAYDPFNNIADENILLDEIIKLYFDENVFFERINQLTGLFLLVLIKNKEVRILGDTSGYLSCFFAVINNYFYVSSHSNLLGDLFELNLDPYIERLIKYPFFKLLGNELPGNLSQFKEVKRLIPNHVLVLTSNNYELRRFYYPHTVEISIDEICKNISHILHTSLKLILEKWKKPAISLSGGCDSKTTLACANGLYDKFQYFSYISSDNESPDANAAAQLCQRLGLNHKIYNIPNEDKDIQDIEIIRMILNWNCGGLIPNNRNDVRKRAFLEKISDFDVEVKSWGSEIGRSHYTKRLNGRLNFGEYPTPRQCTILYKYFLFNRKLIWDTDKVFNLYLNKYFNLARDNPIPWQDQFFWEYYSPSRNGITLTGEHKYSSDITIPCNNRRIMELLLSVPEDKRINDYIYTEIRKYMNPAIDEESEIIININHTKTRTFCDNLYYCINTTLPF